VRRETAAAAAAPQVSRWGEEQDAQWVVDTVMRGDFKASPAHFLYTIGLRGDKISALRVEFLGSLKETS